MTLTLCLEPNERSRSVQGSAVYRFSPPVLLAEPIIPVFAQASEILHIHVNGISLSDECVVPLNFERFAGVHAPSSPFGPPRVEEPEDGGDPAATAVSSPVRRDQGQPSMVEAGASQGASQGFSQDAPPAAGTGAATVSPGAAGVSGVAPAPVPGAAGEAVLSPDAAGRGPSAGLPVYGRTGPEAAPTSAPGAVGPAQAQNQGARAAQRLRNCTTSLVDIQNAVYTAHAMRYRMGDFYIDLSTLLPEFGYYLTPTGGCERTLTRTSGFVLNSVAFVFSTRAGPGVEFCALPYPEFLASLQPAREIRTGTAGDGSYWLPVPSFVMGQRLRISAALSPRYLSWMEEANRTARARAGETHVFLHSDSPHGMAPVRAEAASGQAAECESASDGEAFSSEEGGSDARGTRVKFAHPSFDSREHGEGRENRERRERRRRGDSGKCRRRSDSYSAHAGPDAAASGALGTLDRDVPKDFDDSEALEAYPATNMLPSRSDSDREDFSAGDRPQSLRIFSPGVNAGTGAVAPRRRPAKPCYIHDYFFMFGTSRPVDLSYEGADVRVYTAMHNSAFHEEMVRVYLFYMRQAFSLLRLPFLDHYPQNFYIRSYSSPPSDPRDEIQVYSNVVIIPNTFTFLSDPADASRPLVEAELGKGSHSDLGSYVLFCLKSIAKYIFTNVCPPADYASNPVAEILAQLLFQIMVRKVFSANWSYYWQYLDSVCALSHQNMSVPLLWDPVPDRALSPAFKAAACLAKTAAASAPYTSTSTLHRVFSLAESNGALEQVRKTPLRPLGGALDRVKYKSRLHAFWPVQSRVVLSSSLAQKGPGIGGYELSDDETGYRAYMNFIQCGHSPVSGLLASVSLAASCVSSESRNNCLSDVPVVEEEMARAARGTTTRLRATLKSAGGLGPAGMPFDASVGAPGSVSQFGQFGQFGQTGPLGQLNSLGSPGQQDFPGLQGAYAGPRGMCGSPDSFGDGMQQLYHQDANLVTLSTLRRGVYLPEGAGADLSLGPRGFGPGQSPYCGEDDSLVFPGGLSRVYGERRGRAQPGASMSLESAGPSFLEHDPPIGFPGDSSDQPDVSLAEFSLFEPVYPIRPQYSSYTHALYLNRCKMIAIFLCNNLEERVAVRFLHSFCSQEVCEIASFFSRLKALTPHAKIFRRPAGEQAEVGSPGGDEDSSSSAGGAGVSFRNYFNTGVGPRNAQGQAERAVPDEGPDESGGDFGDTDASSDSQDAQPVEEDDEQHNSGNWEPGNEGEELPPPRAKREQTLSALVHTLGVCAYYMSIGFQDLYGAKEDLLAYTNMPCALGRSLPRLSITVRSAKPDRQERGLPIDLDGWRTDRFVRHSGLVGYEELCALREKYLEVYAAAVGSPHYPAAECPVYPTSASISQFLPEADKTLLARTPQFDWLIPSQVVHSSRAAIHGLYKVVDREFLTPFVHVARQTPYQEDNSITLGMALSISYEPAVIHQLQQLHCLLSLPPHEVWGSQITRNICLSKKLFRPLVHHARLHFLGELVYMPSLVASGDAIRERFEQLIPLESSASLRYVGYLSMQPGLSFYAKTLIESILRSLGEITGAMKARGRYESVGKYGTMIVSLDARDALAGDRASWERGRRPADQEMPTQVPPGYPQFTGSSRPSRRSAAALAESQSGAGLAGAQEARAGERGPGLAFEGLPRSSGSGGRHSKGARASPANPAPVRLATVGGAGGGAAYGGYAAMLGACAAGGGALRPGLQSLGGAGIYQAAYGYPASVLGQGDSGAPGQALGYPGKPGQPVLAAAQGPYGTMYGALYGASHGAAYGQQGHAGGYYGGREPFAGGEGVLSALAVDGLGVPRGAGVGDRAAADILRGNRPLALSYALINLLRGMMYGRLSVLPYLKWIVRVEVASPTPNNALTAVLLQCLTWQVLTGVLRRDDEVRAVVSTLASCLKKGQAATVRAVALKLFTVLVMFVTRDSACKYISTALDAPRYFSRGTAGQAPQTPEPHTANCRHCLEAPFRPSVQLKFKLAHRLLQLSTDPHDPAEFKDAIFDCLAGLFSNSTMAITVNEYIAEPLSGRFLRLLFAGTLVLDGESLFTADRAEILMFYKAFHTVLFNFGSEVGRSVLFACPICMSGGSCQCSRISWPKVPFGLTQRFLQASWYPDLVAELASAKPSSPAEVRDAFERVMQRLPAKIAGDGAQQDEFRHVAGYMDQLRYRLSSAYYSRTARAGVPGQDEFSGYHLPDMDSPSVRLDQTPNKGALVFRQACYDSLLCDRASLLAEEMMRCIFSPENLNFRHRLALLEVYSCAFGLSLVRRAGAAITPSTPGMPYAYAQHYCKMSDMARQALREATICNRSALTRLVADQHPEDATSLGLLLQVEFPSNEAEDRAARQRAAGDGREGCGSERAGARREGRETRETRETRDGQEGREGKENREGREGKEAKEAKEAKKGEAGPRSILRFGGFVLGAVEGGEEIWGRASEGVQADRVAQ